MYTTCNPSQVLTALKRLVDCLTRHNQEVIDYITRWDFVGQTQCSALKNLLKMFESEDHWSTWVKNEKLLSQPIKDELLILGKKLEGELIHRAEPWIKNQDHILSIDELEQWRRDRIMIHKTVITELILVARSFYPTHFRLPH